MRRGFREDGCAGHFFESRFYSGALLSEDAVLAAMAYVDLNPVRAKIAKSILECENCSITSRLARLQNSADRLEELLGPLVSGLGNKDRQLPISLKAYVERLRDVIADKDNGPDGTSRWVTRVATIRKRQRAFGSKDLLSNWKERQGRGSYPIVAFWSTLCRGDSERAFLSGSN